MSAADICVLDTLSGQTKTLESKDKEADLLETRKPVVEVEREITEERQLTRLSSQEDLIDESVSDSVSLRSGETMDGEMGKERYMQDTVRQLHIMSLSEHKEVQMLLML